MVRYDCLPTQNHKGSSGKATAFITMKKNWHASFKIKGGGKYWMFWVCCFVGLPECPQHHLPLLGLGHMVSTQNHLGLVLHKVADPAAKLQYWEPYLVSPHWPLSHDMHGTGINLDWK